MIYKIAELLRDEISGLNIVEIAAGLAKPTVVRNNATDLEADVPAMEDITIPMAYNDLGIECEEGDLYALMPNTKKKSIHWFEDNGVEIVSEDTYYYHVRASLTLVSWWNMPLINLSLRDPSISVANLIAAIPVKLTTVDYMSQIRVAFDGEEPSGSEVLGRYTFNTAEDQVATYPYAVTGIRLAVDFAFGKNCVDSLFILPSPCPPKMTGAPLAFLTVTYAATQAVITIFLPTYANFTINWGDGTSEVVEGLGNLTAVVLTSAYTAAGAYNITLEGGYANITTITMTQAFVSGDVSGWSVFVNLINLTLTNAGVTGDISSWSAMASILTINIQGTSLSGDVSSWAAFTLLQSLFAANSNISGAITGWSTMSLAAIDVQGTSVTGNIGGVGSIATLVLLTGNNNSLTYATVALSAMLAFVSLQDNAWTAGEVDQFLIDLNTAVTGGGFVNLAGTNAGRTAASNAAVASLTIKGWGIITN